MLAGLMLDKLVFDPLLTEEGSNVGSYIRAGTDGTLISWTQTADVPASLVMQDLTFTSSCDEYDPGNSITVEYIDPALPNQSLSVSVVGQAISVSLATDVTPVVTSTAADIAAAIAASIPASELVSVVVSGVGTNVQAAQIATSLANGTTKSPLDVHPIGTPANGIFHEDCQHISGDKGQFMLAVRHDADTSLVSHDGDYAPLQVDANGKLKVDATLDVTFDYVYAEDDPNASGSLGVYTLAVRRDTLAINTSNDGDYADFKVNDRGGLWSVPVGTVADNVADNEYPVKVGSRSEWGALGALGATNNRADLISDKYRRVYVNDGANINLVNTNKTVGVTAQALYVGGAALGGRRTIMIQNLGTKAIFVGDAAVTVANGVRVAASSAIDLDIGQDVAVYAISTAASQDVRVMELG
jgi:hypothetical protein